MFHIIVNPASRSGKGRTIWTQIVQPRLAREGIRYTVSFSHKPGEVERLTAEITASAAPGEDTTLILFGGDGTMNEALQGIRDFSRVRIGYIPTGSSNDLARDLGIPKDTSAALDIILQGIQTGSERAYDLGLVTYPDGTYRRFAVSCGIGFDAAVCQEALRSNIKDFLNRLGLGKLTYMGIALKQLVTARKASCTLTLPGQEPIHISRLLFLTGMVHRFEGGGFRFCPDANATDGILNICSVGDFPKPLVPVALPTAFWGKHYMFRGITPYEANRYEIRTSIPLWVHTDGEVSRKADCFTVSCAPGLLRMLVPQNQNLS